MPISFFSFENNLNSEAIKSIKWINAAKEPYETPI